MAILAYLPDSEIEDYLRRTDLTADFGSSHDAPSMWAQIAQTRGRGYAVNPGLIVEGSWGMGAAVFDGNGTPRWALSLTGIEQRFTPERRAKLGPLLLQAAHDLGKAISRLP